MNTKSTRPPSASSNTTLTATSLLPRTTTANPIAMTITTITMMTTTTVTMTTIMTIMTMKTIMTIMTMTTTINPA